MIAYARAVVIRILHTSEELNDLQTMIGSFATHLQAVYELDSFYGDDTLRGLLDHAISFNKQMDTFDYIISLTEADTQPIEKGPDDDNTQEEENPA